MRTTYLLLLLLATSPLFAQHKRVNIPRYVNGDTTLHYGWKLKLAQKLNLPLLLNSQHSFHFRLWTTNQVVDIWQPVEGQPTGQIMTWTDEIVSNKEVPTNRTHSIIQEINADTARLVHNLISRSGIIDLPSDESIPGWQHGFDGTTYIIEFATPTTYFFKLYWTPSAQGQLKEAVQVKTFVDSLTKHAGLNTAFTNFAASIPFECYSNGGPSVACRILTKSEQRKFLKERDQYRRSKAATGER
jgi:hypothetical protein